jgi:[ribosomal protein S5]-alanine N-acetyltransferase
MQNYSAVSQKIFPIIDCGEFILREKCDADVEDFFAYYADPEVSKFILCEIPQDLESARRELHYWRNVFYQNDGIYFAIADKSTGRMIGSIGLTGHNAYQSRIEISYDLACKYWRRGIATKAIEAVVKYAYQNFYGGRINRIEAFASVENEPSKNLLLKSGFVLEGVLRQHRYHRGSYVDVCSFSMLRSDFVTRKI